jgi:hypothetical protein
MQVTCFFEVQNNLFFLFFSLQIFFISFSTFYFQDVSAGGLAIEFFCLQAKISLNYEPYIQKGKE